MREMTLVGFAAHLARFVVLEDELRHKGLERAARVVEREAKREIGTYQDEAGPFVGWASLADATIADRVRQGYTPDDPGLRSGEMQANIGHVVDSGEAVVGSPDDKMVYFELGTSKQPARSVLGGALVRKTEEVTRILGETYVAALIGDRVFQGAIDLSPE